MKRFFLQLLNKIAAFTNWKWLYFLAGISLLSTIESCKPVIQTCYKPMVPENDSIAEPRCFSRPMPIDTVILEEPTDNIKPE